MRAAKMLPAGPAPMTQTSAMGLFLRQTEAPRVPGSEDSRR